MKIRYQDSVLSFFIVVVLSGCSTTKNVKFKVELLDKLNPEIVNLNSLILSKNGKEIKTILPNGRGPYISNEITVEDLKIGTYQMIYENIIGQKISKDFRVKFFQSKINFVYTDLVHVEKKAIGNFISNLNPGEKLTLRWEMRGCFEQFFDLLEIKNQSGKYEMAYHGNSRILTEEEVEYLNQFESELRQLTDYSNCTDSEIYQLSNGNESVSFKDYTCRWNGMYRIREKLNLQKW